jgi:nucleotidyltransferase/DNA polymerase involved in DNA repair
MGVPPVPSSYRSSRPRNDPVTPRSGGHPPIRRVNVPPGVASGGTVVGAARLSSVYWVLQVDLDQFIAAVEVLRRPELAGQPVVVGGHGDPTRRGVVATASYAAREYGVRSGRPLRAAAVAADAAFLPADNPAYKAASEDVMAVLRGFGPGAGAVVEVMGWDEAFVGVTTDGPEGLARRIQGAVHTQTRLSCWSASATTSCGQRSRASARSRPCAMTAGRASERASSGSPGRTGMR